VTKFELTNVNESILYIVANNLKSFNDRIEYIRITGLSEIIKPNGIAPKFISANVDGTIKFNNAISVNLYVNKIKSLEPFLESRNLKRLNVKTDNANLNYLVNCKKLTCINIIGDIIPPKRPFRKFNDLKCVKFDYDTKIRSLNFLRNCKNLEEISLFHNGLIESLEPLKELKNLKYVRFYTLNSSMLNCSIEGIIFSNNNFNL
jgi:hypothetical protein